MKNREKLLLSLIAVFVFCSIAQAGPAENKAVVLRYFEEVIDQSNPDVVSELFTVNAVQPFPGNDYVGIDAIRDFVTLVATSLQSMESEVIVLVAEGDEVIAQIVHQAVFAESGVFPSRVGLVQLTGQTVIWDAMARFTFEGDKIAEEWINRDELGMLIQMGVDISAPLWSASTVKTEFPQKGSLALNVLMVLLLPFGFVLIAKKLN